MYRRILVPLDGSELSETSLEHVRVLGKGTPAPEIILLTIVEPFDPSQRYTWSKKTSGEAIAEEIRRWETEEARKWLEEAREYLDGTAASLLGEGIRVRTSIAEGAPAEKILAYVRENNIDLVIMATHGRSGLSRWTLGSITDKVVHAAVVPVLVVTPKRQVKP